MTKVSCISLANEFAQKYLSSNPNASQQDLQAALRDHLQEMRKNGAKISEKQIAQVNALSGDIYKANVEQIKANFLTQPTQKTTTAVDTLKSQQTENIYPKYNEHLRPDHHYDSFNNLSKKAVSIFALLK